MAIRIDNVSFSYGNGRNVHPVLHDISFDCKDDELIALLGANGAGKSTLFKCILGLLTGYTGSILIDGCEASSLPAGRLAKHIAYIPQLHYPSFSYSVLNMVLMGTGGQISAFSSPGRKQVEASMEALDKLGISSLADRDYAILSGGEQQLVLMARALVQSAPIWILDEPVANLDLGNQVLVQEQLKKLSHEGHLILMSSHNPEQSFMFADRIIAMKEGKLLANGTPCEVMNEALIQELYGIDVTVESLCEDRVRVCVPRNLTRGTLQGDPVRGTLPGELGGSHENC